MNKQKVLALISHLSYDTPYNHGDVNSGVVEALTELARADKSIIDAATEMYAMLELAISLMDGDSIEDFTYQYQEISTLLAKVRGETL